MTVRIERSNVGTRRRRHQCDNRTFPIGLIHVLILSPVALCHAFVPHSPHACTESSVTTTVTTVCAKRNKGRREDDLNNWYDDDDDNSPSGGKFWEEIERQRLFNQLGGDPNAAASSELTNVNNPSSMSMMDMNGLGGSMATTAMRTTESMTARKPPTMEQLKSAEATLSEYTLFQVNDNWLDENLQSYFSQLNSLDNEPPMTLEEETRRLEEQLEALPDGIGPGRAFLDVDSEEPWEHWGDDDTVVDLDRAKTLEVPQPSPGML